LNNITIIFGKNLRGIREFLGISQADLAKRAKLTPAAICQIENGLRDPQLKTTVQIITALGVPLERLLKDLE